MTVDDLVAEWLRLRETGPAPSPEEFAAAHGGEGELLSAIRSLVEAESAIPTTSGLPDLIGRYRVGTLLGAGASGMVLKGVAEDGTEVALKMLAPGLVGDSRARARHAREAEMLRDVQHPNVVRVLEVVEAGSTPVLVMEHVSGRDLGQRLDAGDIVGDEDRFIVAARIAAGIAHGLSWAHARALVHRDLKPSNVILRPDGTPVLVDFGLAADERATALTRTGDVLGTPAYMAPEQARGRRVGPAADVYALGAITFEMVAGRPPFTGDQPGEMMRRLRRSPAPRVRSVCPSCPRPLARIVDAMLAPNPAWRPTPVGAVAADLEAFLGNRPVAARPPGMLRRFGWRVVANPAPVGVLLIVILGLATGLLISTARDRERRRQESLDKAVRVAALAILEPMSPNGLDAAATVVRSLAPDHPWSAALEWLREGRTLETTDDPLLRRIQSAERVRREGDSTRAVTMLLDLVKEEPASDLAWAVLLEAARDLDDGGEVIALAQDARVRSDVLSVGLAHLLSRAGRHVEAARLLSKVRSDSRWLGYHQACAEWRGGEEARALATAGKTDVESRIQFARFLEGLDRRDRALEVYRDVLTADPGRLDARFHLANSLATEERVVEARAEYEALLVHHPNHAPTLVALAWLHAWVCGHESCKVVRDPDRAMTLATAALRADRGAQRLVVGTATRIARHLDRRGELRAVVVQLRRAGRDAGRPVALLDDALRDLDQ
ncbi:MAG: hypothetical protein CMJ83_15975 [Planctomycetes bacterium]|nr:hypothetical protein [Planctomycetota bacterium]